MENLFQKLLKKPPLKKEENIWCFGKEENGDYFEETDILQWRNGLFEENWKRAEDLENNATNHIINEIVKNKKIVIDLASGPGMGLIPSIKQIDASFPCVASDANSTVLKEWKQYLEKNQVVRQLDFAQFSIFDIPFKDNSVDAYSSYIGISSTRNGNDGYNQALKEIHRTLADGGMLFCVESEWNNVPEIINLFEKNNMQTWDCFKEEQVTWHERFIENGFEILFEKPCVYHGLNKDDNELGKLAFESNVNIGITFTAYIVKNKKCRNI